MANKECYTGNENKRSAPQKGETKQTGQMTDWYSYKRQRNKVNGMIKKCENK